MSAWIEVLRVASANGKQKSVAKQIGYSSSVISQVLTGTYRDELPPERRQQALKRIQMAVEGALLKAEVACPILGELPQQKCIELQRRPFSAANPTDVQLYRSCRGGCPHSLIGANAEGGSK